MLIRMIFIQKIIKNTIKNKEKTKENRNHRHETIERILNQEHDPFPPDDLE